MNIKVLTTYLNLKRWKIQFYLNTYFLKTKNSKTLFNIKKFIAGTIISILTLILFIPIVIINPQTDFSGNEEIVIAIGSSIATILAVTFTLSIVPIQKASEAWSPAVARIIKRDRKAFIGFATISFFSSALFVLSIKNYLSAKWFLIISFVLFAATLDIVRWYYEYICNLMDPESAIRFLKEFSLKAINNYKNSANLYAKYGYNLQAQKNWTLEYFKNEFYTQKSEHQETVKKLINELTEMATRPLKRGETIICCEATITIAKITNSYLISRQDNLAIKVNYETFPGHYESDSDGTLCHIFESLRKINETAIEAQDNNVALCVLNACCSIFEEISNLRQDTYLLTYIPLGYFEEFISTAKNKARHEVLLRSADILFNSIKNLREKIPINYVYNKLLEILEDISLYFFNNNHPELANIILGKLMRTITHLFNQKHSQFSDFLFSSLNAIAQLIPSAIESQKYSKLPFVSSTREVYSYALPFSLFHLVKIFSSLIQKDFNDKRPEPYGYFLSLSKITSDHICDIANKNTLSEVLFYEISETTKNIIILLTSLIESPVEDNVANEEKIIHEIRNYLAFYSAVYKNIDKVNFKMITKGCDTICYSGLLFSNLSWHATSMLISRGKQIKTIIDGYCSAEKNFDCHKIVKLMIFILYLKKIAEYKTYPLAILELKNLLEQKPPSLDDQKWQTCLDLFITRCADLNEKIQKPINKVYPESNSEDFFITIIKQLLENKQTSTKQQIPSEQQTDTII